MCDLDIYSKGEYPANVLSNFYPNEFVFDGIHCASMEGFLQSLKYKNLRKQSTVCGKAGAEAKKAGKIKFLWKWTGNVYWRGQRYKRTGKPFFELILRAYRELNSQNAVFRKALEAAAGKVLRHSIGKQDQRKTILTEKEFIACLNDLRKRYH